MPASDKPPKGKPESLEQRIATLAEANDYLTKKNDALSCRVTDLEKKVAAGLAAVDPTIWSTIFAQIQKVSDSGLANMLDLRQVQNVANQLDCSDLARVCHKLITSSTTNWRVVVWNELLASARMPPEPLVPRTIVRYRCSRLATDLGAMMASDTRDLPGRSELETIVRRAILDRGARSTEDLVRP